MMPGIVASAPAVAGGEVPIGLAAGIALYEPLWHLPFDDASGTTAVGLANSINGTYIAGNSSVTLNQSPLLAGEPNCAQFGYGSAGAEIDNSEMPTAYTEFSIVALMKPNDVTQGPLSMFVAHAFGAGDAADAWQFRRNGSTLQFIKVAGGIKVVNAVAGSANPNEVALYGLTVRSNGGGLSQAELYRNGRLMASQEIAEFDYGSSPTANVGIGRLASVTLGLDKNNAKLASHTAFFDHPLSAEDHAVIATSGGILDDEITGDEYYDQVSALLHFDGADGSTTITDETGNTWASTGTVTIDDAQSVFGGGSVLLGSGYLQPSDDSAWNFGTGDFTIEGRIRRFNNTTTYATLMGSGHSTYSSGARFLALRGNGAPDGNQRNKLALGGFGFPGGADLVRSATELAVDTWYAFAITRQGNTFRLFIDGALEHTVVSSETMDFGAGPEGFVLGANGWDLVGGRVQAWLDELRVTKGFCRYELSYVPATQAFPDSL